MIPSIPTPDQGPIVAVGELTTHPLLSTQRLQGMRCGIEKESLRFGPDGRLARTPHPGPLGSALTHPHITTDFSESQLELITGVHGSPQACLDELMRVHQFVYRTLRAHGDESLWTSSMPCGLPADETIPIGVYGASNVGRAKSVYRMGLGHRYGRRMQTISGIHYNWSLPGLSDADHFGLIRNFRRHAFVLLVLLGASPLVCPSFVAGREHPLQRISPNSLGQPHGTSLRMGRLGYQSEAQASLAVSYNSLDGYAASLQDALTRPYPAYEAIGVRNLGGEYNQLATSLLQIENEFYSTIRPKRSTFPGERPLHALRERGVEYVEVRLLDLDPFEPIGIGAHTLALLDTFLLHCLVQPSPPDTPEEIAALARNQRLAAEAGRQPDLLLEREGRRVLLRDWAAELLAAMQPVARAADAALGTTRHAEALDLAQERLATPDALPSARVMRAVLDDHGGDFIAFGKTRAQQARDHVLAQDWDSDWDARFAALAAASREKQAEIEAGDTLPFEQYRLEYISAERLTPRHRHAA